MLRLFDTTLRDHIIVHLNILFLFCFFNNLALNFWLFYWLLLFFILYLIFWYLVVLTDYKLDRLSALCFFKFWVFNVFYVNTNWIRWTFATVNGWMYVMMLHATWVSHFCLQATVLILTGKRFSPFFKITKEMYRHTQKAQRF